MFPKDPNLEMDFTLESERSGIIDEPAFQLLVMGDWTADGEKPELSQRRPIEIDRDNFDDVMRGLGVKLNLSEAAGAGLLEFDSLVDFHPDEIFKRVPLFSQLRDLRKRLRNSDTFNSAAREVRKWSTATENNEIEPVDTPKPPESPAENLLDAILTKPEGGAASPKPAVSADISQLISELVRPHLVTVDENEQSAMIAAVDVATSELMRKILHDRRFQELEAGWRGLFFLVRRTETASDLRIYILDITKDELATDLRNADGPVGSVVQKRYRGGINEDPWAAVAGNFAFLPNVNDIATLIRLAKTGSAARSPFISHIRPEVIGVKSLSEHPDPSDWQISDGSDENKLWNALRDMDESKFLGLTMPRFLARLPYGSDTEPAEAFDFEEFNDAAAHDDYLWANGCFVAAQLLAQTYRELGWDFGQQFFQDADGLPLHVYKQDGQTVYQSCAEVQLSQNAAEELMDFGIMPIVSFKNMDRIRLGRFQSISNPVRILKGRWSQ